jgi:hypothetical protein
MTHQGTYRAAEGDFLDLNIKEQADWAKSHYPALMANRPSGMSEDYQFMPSHTIAKTLHNDFGLRLVEVGQQHSRSRDPAGQEHFMKFRMPNEMMNLNQVGDSIPELVIMNSHNGRSTIRAYAGIFRFVCANGMVVSEQSFGQIKLRHFGEKNTFSVFQEVLTGMARRINVLDARLAKMNSVMLSPLQQRRLAKEVMGLRKVPDWVETAHVLEAHRPADMADADGLRSLWVTFNVIQENLTARTVVHAPENSRPVQMRPITGARAHVLTNEKIWNGLEVFAEENFKDLGLDLEELFDQPALALEAPKAEPKAAPRSATEILSLATYEQLCDATPEELEAFTPEEKKKLSSRKSYLKRKAAAVS